MLDHPCGDGIALQLSVTCFDRRHRQHPPRGALNGARSNKDALCASLLGFEDLHGQGASDAVCVHAPLDQLHRLVLFEDQRTVCMNGVLDRYQAVAADPQQVRSCVFVIRSSLVAAMHFRGQRELMLPLHFHPHALLLSLTHKPLQPNSTDFLEHKLGSVLVPGIIREIFSGLPVQSVALVSLFIVGDHFIF